MTPTCVGKMGGRSSRNPPYRNDPHACGETQVPERPVMTSRGAPSQDEETGEIRIAGYTLPSQGRVPGEMLCMRQERRNTPDSRVG